MAVNVSTLGIKVTSDGIKEASSSLGGLTTSARNAEKSVSALEQAMDKLEKASKTATGQADLFNQKLVTQQATLSTLNKDTTASAQATSQLAASMAALSNTILLVVNHTNSARTSQRGHNEAMREAHALARGLSGSLGALWVTYGNFTGMAAGIAIGASLKSIVSVGKEVENTLEGLRVKGQESVESVNKIRDSVMDLGKGVYGPREVAKAFETMILAGLNAKQALSGISDALNLATVGGTTIEKSAYTLVQVGTALGYTAENYSRIADVIAMTAAVSMSSVESLSEAFKSASVVGKLYGVTLVDIGTSLAALSNLGIQGSAAGTSLKNFYKELASSSDKVKSTLKDMKMVPEDFKDAEGNYLGILAVVKKLAEGLGNLTEAQQKIAIANLSNERGMKTAVELLDLYKRKVEGTTTAGNEHKKMLEDLQTKIDQSYGFAAIGAAQMALTVSSQFKSVANTLETVFLGAFQKVSPEISIVANKLKQVFNSPEFIDGIQTVAILFAKLAVAIAENIPLVVKIVEALIAFKVIAVIVTMLEGAVAAFVAIRAALAATTISAALLTASLGPLVVAIAAVAAAYIALTSASDLYNISSKQKNALQYSKDYADALGKEADRMLVQIDLMKKGASAADAEAESLARRNMELMKDQNRKATDEAKDKVDAARKLMSVEDEARFKRMGGNAQELANYKKLTEAKFQQASITAQVAAEEKKAQENADKIAQYAIHKEEVRKAIEARDKVTGTGTGAVTGKVKSTHADDNEAFMEAQKKFDAEMKKAKTDLQTFEESLNRQFKAGEIGKLQVIEQSAAKQTEVYSKERQLIKDRIAEVEAAPADLHKKPNLQVLTRQLEANEKLLNDVKIKAREEVNVRLANLEDENNQRTFKNLEAAGKYVEAAAFKYSTEYSKAYKSTEAEFKNVSAELEQSVMDPASVSTERVAELNRMVTILGQSLEGIGQAKIEMTGLAKLKEDTEKLDAKMAGFRTAIDTVFDAAQANGGLSAALDAEGAAKAIQDKYMPAVADLVASLKTLAGENPGNEKMLKAYEEAQKKLQGMSDVGIKAAQTIGTAFKALGDDIANSLGKAFGSVGSALGGAVQAYTNYAASRKDQDAKYIVSHDAAVKKASSGDATAVKELTKLETDYRKKSTTDEVSMYASMAGAAKGMFNEKSTAYKVLDGIEKAMHMWKIASQAIEIAGTITAGSTAVAWSGYEAEAAYLSGDALALEAIAAQGQGDPYSAFARIAAMAAIMAALGFAVGGGGGGQSSAVSSMPKNTGTGTVLGDENAQSKSLEDSSSILAANSNISLHLSQGMLNALNTIRDNIGALAATISTISGIRGTNADAAGINSSSSFLGLFGSETKLSGQGLLFGQEKITQSSVDTEVEGQMVRGFTIERKFISQTVDDIRAMGIAVQKFTDITTTSTGFLGSLFGGGPSTSTQMTPAEAKLKSQIQGVILGSVDAVINGATALGGNKTELTKSLGNESVDLGKIDFSGMTGKEVQETLNAVFSAFTDTMTEKALPVVKDFQRTGEGAFTTMTRLIAGIDQAAYSLEALGIKAIDFTDIVNKKGDIFTEISRQSIVQEETTGLGTVKGGLGAQQISGVGQIIQNSGLQGQDLIDYYARLKTLTSQMKLFGDSSADITQTMISAAHGMDRLEVGIRDYYDKFFSAEEKLKAHGKGLGESFSALGREMPASREAFRAMVEGQEKITESGQKAWAGLVALSGQTDSYFSQLEEQQNSTLVKAGTSVSALADIIRGGLMGAIKPADLKAQLHNAIIGGVYQALAQDTASNITKTFTDKILQPVLEANGKAGEIQEILSKANIDTVMTSAKQAIEALKLIYNNPAFKAAMKELGDLVDGLAGSISSVGESYVPMVVPEESTATSSAAAEAKKGHALEIELLKLQGRALESLNLQRSDELDNLDAEDKITKNLIYELQDLQKIRDLETQLLQAEGKTYAASIRQREDALKLLTDEQKIIQQQIYTAQDKAKTDDLNLQIMKLSGDEAGVLAAQRDKELKALSDNDKSLQMHIYLLQDQTKAANDSIEAMKKIVAMIDQVGQFGQQLDDTIVSIRKETAGFDTGGYLAEKLKNTKAEFEAVLGGNDLQDKLVHAKALQETIMEQYGFEKSELEKKAQKEEELYNKSLAAQNEAINAANQLSDAFRGIGEYANTMLVGPSSPMSLRAKIAESTKQYQDLLNKIRGGDIEAAGKLTGASGTNLELIKTNSKTSLEYARAFMHQQLELANIGDMAKDKMEQIVGTGFQMSQGLQDEMNHLQENTIAELQNIQEQTYDWLKELRDKLTAQATIFAGIGLSAAMIAAQTANLDIRIADALAAVLGGQSSNTRDWGVNADMNKWLASMTNYKGDFGQGGFNSYLAAHPEINFSALQSQYALAHPGAGGNIPSFDVGTNLIPEDMFAMLHAGERVVPAADNSRLEAMVRSGAGRDEEEVVKELREVKALLASMGVSIEKTQDNTKDSAKYGKDVRDVIQQVGRDGQTLQVTTTAAT